MADTTPAHLFIPDATPDPDFPSDEHRRIVSRCNPGGGGISFGKLHDVLAADPYTAGIGLDDQMKLGQLLGELVAAGDVYQSGEFFIATDDGWEKLTHFKANTEGVLE